jgi:hypothetical protein
MHGYIDFYLEHILVERTSPMTEQEARTLINQKAFNKSEDGLSGNRTLNEQTAEWLFRPQ